MSQRVNVAIDTETTLIGGGQPIPDLVCATFAMAEVGKWGLSVQDPLEETLKQFLEDDRYQIVMLNAAFDVTAIAKAYPSLHAHIWQAIMQRRFTNVATVKKLHHLGQHGGLKVMETREGHSVRLEYSLAAMAMEYLGVDISAGKEGVDSWRLRYGELADLPFNMFPADAREYAEQDAAVTILIHEEMERRGHTSPVEWLHTQAEIALAWTKFHGIAVDYTRVPALGESVGDVLESTKGLLEAVGIIRTQQFGEPYAKDMERAIAVVGFKPENWDPFVPALVEQGIKMKKPKAAPGSLDTGKLQEYAEAAYVFHGIAPAYTDGGAIQLDAEALDEIAVVDEVLATYRDRKEVDKLATQILPMLANGATVYPDYTVLVETGRISSFDGGKARAAGEERKYSSVNITQIPGEIRGLDARQCFTPRPGHVYWDCDYTALELAATGHVTYSLFGHSVHRDRYNDGTDLHGYLGAQLMLLSEDTPEAKEFAQECRNVGARSPIGQYEVFYKLKSHPEERLRKAFKHYRTFAKPVGLGFPGGLGPATMVGFARSTYGVTMTEDQAREFREMWRATYPEMVEFFAWVNNQVDHANSDPMSERTAYRYTSPLGMVRAGTTFCSAANGMVMQTPGAEAAKSGMILVARACADPQGGSILYGNRFLAFIHDQVIGETGPDPALWEAECMEVAKLMRQGAESVLTSIKMRTDDAHLTERWSKASGPVYDPHTSKMIPWRPK